MILALIICTRWILPHSHKLDRGHLFQSKLWEVSSHSWSQYPSLDSSTTEIYINLLRPLGKKRYINIFFSFYAIYNKPHHLKCHTLITFIAFILETRSLAWFSRSLYDKQKKWLIPILYLYYCDLLTVSLPIPQYPGRNLIKIFIKILDRNLNKNLSKVLISNSPYCLP